MVSRRYQASLNREQEMLLPPRIDDYVSQNNTVRAIDAYVGTLDLKEQGFQHTDLMVSLGQPPFNPSALLKLYLYGYLQGIRSSRKLENETRRNLEVIWLVEGVLPTYKTIADFRKNNSDALKSVNRDFILLCKELSLFGGETVGVDGSFFKADANKSSIYTEDKLEKQLAALEKKISEYQDALKEQDANDDGQNKGSLSEDNDLAEKLALIQAKKVQKQALQQQLKDSGEKQISTVDKDARLLTKYGQTVAGYNVQIAVDEKHRLIVAEDVVQDGNDTQQLSPMLKKAQDLLQSDNLEGLGDAGYYNGTQIKACEEQNITVYVSVPNRSKKRIKEGRFSREQFEYDAEQDCYICPQGERLNRSGNPRKLGDKNYLTYRNNARICRQCPINQQCLSKKSQRREIERWEHEEVVEKHKQRMKENPEKMRQRGTLVEHPFGTLKHRAGMHHFLMRGLKKCQGEFSLMVLTYNFTRVLNTLGVDVLRDYCLQRQENSPQNVKYV